MKDFDLNFVRSHFYAFDPGNPLRKKAFFENAGGSFPCKFVVDKLTKFYQTTKVQPYGHFDGSIEAGEEMVNVDCKYNEKFKKWEPVERIESGEVVSLNSLSL